MGYCGIMLCDLLNLVVVVGYINVSWMFKVDFFSEYFCCLINYMDVIGMC